MRHLQRQAHIQETIKQFEAACVAGFTYNTLLNQYNSGDLSVHDACLQAQSTFQTETWCYYRKLNTHLPATPSLPIVWIDSDSGAQECCAELAKEKTISLDVETALDTQSLLLIQMASPTKVYLIDPLMLNSLSPIATLLASHQVNKVIHNSRFEVSVFKKLGIQINSIIDTFLISRTLRKNAKGGHSLKAVCFREFGITLDKSPQTSNWAVRPLTPQQFAYAALDAEILLDVLAAFQDCLPKPEANIETQQQEDNPFW